MNTNKPEKQNGKVLPTVGFEPGTFCLQSRRSTNCDTIPDIHNWLHFKSLFTCSISLYHVLKLEKYFVRPVL